MNVQITNEELRKLLVKNQLLDELRFADINKFSHDSGLTLVESLVEKNIITETLLGELMAKSLKLSFITLTKVVIPEKVFRLIPERIAKKYKIIAFSYDKEGIRVGMADPQNEELIAMLAKKTGKKIIPYLATVKDIERTFQIYKKDLQFAIDEFVRLHHDEIPTTDVVNLLINYAIQDSASDIHIEPRENNLIVRFRLDGILHNMLKLPKNIHDQIVSRIKVMSKLQTDDHINPQDGKLRYEFEGGYIDIRVSTINTVDGEKVVLRLLPARSQLFSFANLGLSNHDLKKLKKVLDKSYGMILASGPTGSGKTTTIYTILKMLNSTEKNITTIEDPVEYKIKGINQIQTKSSIRFTFAKGLRSILRQDPDVIFVGEIRDIETANIAVNAALTGHVVLSTLHTNDASTALLRLIDMEVEPFLVASTVNIIIAQRLIRKACEQCKKPFIMPRKKISADIDPKLINRYFGKSSQITTYKGEGCKLCNNTGYFGRIGFFEILEVSKSIRKLIVDKADSDVIKKQAISEGMTTMLEDGLNKVKQGLTTMEEVIRVTKSETS